MKSGILVEWDGVGGVGGAKDMAAVPAVMAAYKDAKEGFAHGRVAGRRSRVSLLPVSCLSYSLYVEIRGNVPSSAPW